MHKRAREHVGLVIKRKLMRRRRRIISGKDWWNILHGFMRNDVHRDTASRVFRKKPEDVNDAERRVAKTINYGVMFGCLISVHYIMSVT